MSPRKTREPGNYIAEWFGHRVYPVVADTDRAYADQTGKRCPFVSDVTGTSTECVKPSSKGVCTVSSNSNGERQDWLACPYRVLDPVLLDSAVRRLFDHDADAEVNLVPMPTLEKLSAAKKFRAAVRDGVPSIVYFQNRLGGEIGIRATRRSPQQSFDATMIEILPGDSPGGLKLGRYGIFEIQTMDFHGSYRDAMANLQSALHLHKRGFAAAVQQNPQWVSEGMEGPNIANVFKRTFYQMMFKFQIGGHGDSTGCVFALPRAVWDSWQRHLGAPEMVEHEDGTWRLHTDRFELPSKPSSWIYVFDIATDADVSPSPIKLWRVIGTSAEILAHYALDVAPAAALEVGGSVEQLLDSAQKKLLRCLPELSLG